MAPSRRYLERDLFELGYTAQCLVERAHNFWLWAHPDDKDHEVPPVLCDLVEEMTAGLRHLTGRGLGADVGRLTNDAVTQLSVAWKAYQNGWMRSAHKKQCLGGLDADCIPSPEEQEMLSPLVTDRWSQYRKSLKAAFTALPEELRIWPDLGGLAAQVLSLDSDTREQARILGEVFPIPALQDVLRSVRDAQPAFSDLDVELSDRRTNVRGYKDVDRVQRRVKALRKAILDRLKHRRPERNSSNAGNAESRDNANTALIADQSKPGGRPAVAQGSDAKRAKPKPPSEVAIKAYRFHLLSSSGSTQTEIAEALSRELGRPVSQGTLSRWLRQVTDWIKAGNILPDLSIPTRKPQSIDPGVIDMGERRDRHTQRQREKKTDDE